MILSIAIRALANDRRQLILAWLKKPTKHFPPQDAGDLVEDGVCGYLIARKLRVSELTLSGHMKILCKAGLTRPKLVDRRTFYKRNESGIRKIKKMILSKV